ncbi:MAG: hypothetical protein KDD55_08365 [Bdellovibrionales bacterium]|nr:hypothetical protein [Bdellovibrionales bacterium]
MEISNRIEHLENTAEWIAKESIHTDSGISQSGTLICVLADEIREAIYELARSLESDTDEIEHFH